MAKTKTQTPSKGPVEVDPTTLPFQPLAKEYKKNGYQFKQLKRESNVAMYEQLAEDEETGELKLVCYEVFEIIQMPAGFAGPARYPQPAKEVPPGNEQWGMKGFSPSSLARAEMRYQQIKTRLENREVVVEEKVEDNKKSDTLKKKDRTSSTNASKKHTKRV